MQTRGATYATKVGGQVSIYEAKYFNTAELTSWNCFTISARSLQICFRNLQSGKFLLLFVSSTDALGHQYAPVFEISHLG